MRSRTDRSQRGATIVEFAICAPILFLFVFASFEFARVNSLRQSAENAAYEGCRRGIVPGATADDVRTDANMVLGSVFAQNASVTVTPAIITTDTSSVTVDIVIPLDDNAWVIPNFFANREITATLTLARERGLNASLD